MTRFDSAPSRRELLKASAALAAFAPFTAACAPARVATAQPDGGFMDGVRTAELLRSGDLDAGAVVEAAIARAEAVEPQINAIATKTYAAARAEAADGPRPPFAGMPSFTKDLLDREGEPTFYGSRAFTGYVAPRDGRFAAAWRKAGILSLGKSTTPEMGLISSTEPLVSGPTRNPWDLSRTPGGSSGGAAALTAARVVPFAHASDGGGSIRIPAASCGLFGLKPSRARLWNSSGDPPAVDISVNHAVTWTVRDSVALFRVAQRLDGRYNPLPEITGPSTRRLRIGFAPEPPAGTPLDPEVRAACEAAAELCRGLGHEVVDFTWPFDGEEFADRFLLYWAGGAAAFAEQAAQMSGKPVGPEILEPWTLGLAAAYAAREGEMADTIRYLQGFEIRYQGWLEDLDVVLSPVTGRPADPIGVQDPAGDFDTVMERVLSFAAFTAPMNVAGAASMSVPLGQSASGLPIGVMVSATRGGDERLFELAYELEAAAPWIDRVPPVSA